MFRRCNLVSLLIAALGLLYAAGASQAALACVSPMAQASTAMPMGGDCPDKPKPHDSAQACAPMCAAVPSTPHLSIAMIFRAELGPPVAAAALDDWTGSPEPPPPRAA